MPSADVLRLLFSLLPGFISAAIYYYFTPHQKREWFERTIEALIYSTLVQVSVAGVRWLFLFVGDRIDSRLPWSEDVQLTWSVIIAAGLGLLAAGFANNNTIPGWLSERKWNLFQRRVAIPEAGEFVWTKRTSYPSEWFSAFNHEPRDVILHLTDGRRIHGWPKEWPDYPDAGHFLLTDAEWLTDDGKKIPLQETERILIPGKLVEIVEMMKSADEVAVSTLTPEAGKQET